MFKRAAAAAIGFLLVAASPAWAGSAQCIHDGLPAAKRAEVDRLYDSSLREGLDSRSYSPDELLAALKTCGIERESAGFGPALQAYAGYEFETQAVRWFARRQITPAQLDAAFARIPAAAVARTRQLLSEDSDEAQEALFDSADAFVRSLGLEPDQITVNWAMTYAYGRIVREEGERQVPGGLGRPV